VVCQSQQGLLYPLTLGDEVNFRLIYEGPLKAASQGRDGRRIDKHKLRLAFDEQLNHLLNSDELLAQSFRADPELPKYKRGTLSFWPIVRKSMHMVCDLDILFLRYGIPGRIVSTGGDLDNRIKVLFDALRVPADENEIRGLDNLGPKGIVCLLEDDQLITGFRVTSDQILEAQKPEARHNVRLIINVEIRLTKITQANLGYLRQF
jgi:hypothetical protein